MKRLQTPSLAVPARLRVRALLVAATAGAAGCSAPVFVPDGSTLLSDGAIVSPDGTVIVSDGAAAPYHCGDRHDGTRYDCCVAPGADTRVRCYAALCFGSGCSFSGNDDVCNADEIAQNRSCSAV